MLTCILALVSYFSWRWSCSLWTNGSAWVGGQASFRNSIAVILKMWVILIQNADSWSSSQDMGNVWESKLYFEQPPQVSFSCAKMRTTALQLKWFSWIVTSQVLESLRVRGKPSQVCDDSRQLEAPPRFPCLPFRRPPALNLGVNLMQWSNMSWHLIMNQWWSEVESEQTDSLNSKLNTFCSSSDTEWVTGLVVEAEIRSCKNLGGVAVWSLMP